MMQKIYAAFIRYREANKRDNLEISAGWHKRLQDIYVACHLREITPATGSPSNLWQHYAEKK